MRFIKYLLRSWQVSLLAIICVVYVLVAKLYLAQLPEPFPHAYVFGKILYEIAVAYISSYIFYFLVVVLGDYKERSNVNDYIASQVQRLIGKSREIIRYMADEVGKDFEELSKKWQLSEVEDICNKIDPHNNSPIGDASVLHSDISHLRKFTWQQLFLVNKHELDLLIDKIFSRLPYIDSELVNILSRLQGSTYFFVIPMMEYPLGNRDLSSWSKEIYHLQLIADDLEKYFNKNLKLFLPTRPE